MIGGNLSTLREHYDLVVLGGGLTGFAMAAAAATPGCSVLLIEARPLSDPLTVPFDGRVTAVARGSKLMLDGIGAWATMAEDAEPIRDIVVGESGASSTVHYDHRDVGREPLGWIIENRHIKHALMQRAEKLPSIDVIAPGEMARFDIASGHAKVTLKDGRATGASLLAACEGKFSSTRNQVGIDIRHWAYDQTAMVCTLAHEKPHHGRAIERFFHDGPFAMLPMTQQRSSIVWALDNSLASAIAKLPDDEFVAEVQDRFGWELGALSLEGPRWSYPLSLVWAHRYSSDRLVLVGDTARGIHPIAGQGWNIALRDVGTVAEILIDQKRLGLDPGDQLSLEKYESWRRFDSLALVAITDGINRLFANGLGPLRLMREAGLATVEKVPMAKNFFMRHAMGMVGDLPRLMRGQSL